VSGGKTPDLSLGNDLPLLGLPAPSLVAGLSNNCFNLTE